MKQSGATNISWLSRPVGGLSNNILLIFMHRFIYFFFCFCLAKKEKGPWTLTITTSFPIEFTTTSGWILGPKQLCLFSTLTLPTYSVLGALGLNLGYLSSAQGSLSLSGLFFFGYKNHSDAAADCGEVQNVLSTSGLKGNNWFLPTRLERVNFENLHQLSSRPINSFDLE